MADANDLFAFRFEYDQEKLIGTFGEKGFLEKYGEYLSSLEDMSLQDGKLTEQALKDYLEKNRNPNFKYDEASITGYRQELAELTYRDQNAGDTYDEGEHAGDEVEELEDPEKKRMKELEENLSKITQNADDYNDSARIANMLNIYKEHVEKGSPEIKKGFELLASLSQQMQLKDDDRSFNTEGNKNVTELKYGKDNKLHLMIRNLGGSGLNFSIDENRAIVLTEGQKLTHEQVEALGQYFLEMGIDNIDNFKFNADSKKVKVTGADGKETDFEDAFKESMGNQLEEGQEIEGMGDSEFEEFLKEYELAQNPPGEPATGVPAEGGKLNLSQRNMVNKVKARMKIMGFCNDRLLKTRRMADGSIVIAAYVTEDDIKDDSKTKDNKVSHKKAFAVKVNIVNGMPEVSWYLPQGKALEGGHARIMLEALKSQECEYFVVPSVLDTAGKGQGAFWEAAAKTLMVPLCKSMSHPEGAELSGDNINDMMEALKKETVKHGPIAVSKFKEKLYKQLENYEDYLLKTTGKPLSDAMQIQKDTLKGAVAYQKFNSGPLPELTAFIKKMAEGKDDKGHKIGTRWNAIEVMVAYKALENVINDYPTFREEYAKTHKGDYPGPEVLKLELWKQMNRKGDDDSIESPREAVMSQLNDDFSRNKTKGDKKLDNVIKGMQRANKESVKSTIGKIKSDMDYELNVDVGPFSAGEIPDQYQSDDKTKPNYTRNSEKVGSYVHRPIPVPPEIAKFVSDQQKARNGGR